MDHLNDNSNTKIDLQNQNRTYDGIPYPHGYWASIHAGTQQTNGHLMGTISWMVTATTGETFLIQYEEVDMYDNLSSQPWDYISIISSYYN